MTLEIWTGQDRFRCFKRRYHRTLTS